MQPNARLIGAHTLGNRDEASGPFDTQEDRHCSLTKQYPPRDA